MRENMVFLGLYAKRSLLGTNWLWCILLCASGVSVQAGFFEGRDAHERGDYRAAVNEFRPIAERGNAWAQVYLGEMYEDGKGVPQDYQQAKMWHQRAAEQGDHSAQRHLALLHNNHNIVLLASEISRWPHANAEGEGQRAEAENGETVGSVRGVFREALDSFTGVVTSVFVWALAILLMGWLVWLVARRASTHKRSTSAGRTDHGISSVVELLENYVKSAETFVSDTATALIDLLQRIYEWLVERIRRVIEFIKDVAKLIGRLVKVLCKALVVLSPAVGSVALAVYVPFVEDYKGYLVAFAVFWVVMV